MERMRSSGLHSTSWQIVAVSMPAGKDGFSTYPILSIKIHWIITMLSFLLLSLLVLLVLLLIINSWSRPLCLGRLINSITLTLSSILMLESIFFCFLESIPHASPNC